MVMIFFLKMPFSNVIRTSTSFLRFVSFLFIMSHNGTSIKSHQSQILKGPLKPWNWWGLSDCALFFFAWTACLCFGLVIRCFPSWALLPLFLGRKHLTRTKASSRNFPTSGKGGRVLQLQTKSALYFHFPIRISYLRSFKFSYPSTLLIALSTSFFRILSQNGKSSWQIFAGCY